MKTILKVIGWILLAAVILILASTAGLYFYLKSGMQKAVTTADDITAFAAAEPMGAGKRFTFADDGTVEVFADKADIWWYATEKYGDITGDITEELAAYGIEFESCGIELSAQTGVRADAAARYKNIRLAASVMCDISFENGTFFVRPAAVRIAGITLKRSFIEEKLNLDFSGFEFSFTPETFFLEPIEAVRVTDGGIVFSSRLPDTIPDKLAFMSSREATRNAFFTEEYRYAMPVILNANADKAPYTELIPALQKNAEVFPEYAFEMLTLLKEDARKEAISELEKMNSGFTSRWLPDFRDAGEAAPALKDKYNELTQSCDSAIEFVSEAFSKGKIQISAEGFIYNGNPFSFSEVFEEETLENINDESAFLVLLNHSGVTDTGAPVLKKAVSGEWPFGETLDGSKKYPVGIAARGCDGRPYILYRSTSNTAAQGVVIKTVYYNVVLLTEDEYTALRTETVPVW